MTTFPSLTPSGRRFTPGTFPHTSITSMSGRTARVRHGNVRINQSVALEFIALTEAQMLEILTHYNDREGRFKSFALPDRIWSGTPVGLSVLQEGFAAAYAPSSWTFSANEGDGSIDTSNAPSTIEITGSDSNSGDLINTDYTIEAPGTGIVSFDWDYQSADSGDYDGFGYVLNGVFVKLADNDTQGTGTEQVSVETGDAFGFRVFTTDDSGGVGQVTISQFAAPGPAQALPGGPASFTPSNYSWLYRSPPQVEEIPTGTQSNPRVHFNVSVELEAIP
jgi:hypothetical protein